MMLEASSASGSFGFSLMGYNCTIVYGENKWQIPGMYNFYKVYITYKLLQPTLKVFVSTHLAVLVGKNDHSICIVGLHPVQIIAFHERTLHIKYWRIKWVEKCTKKIEKLRPGNIWPLDISSSGIPQTQELAHQDEETQLPHQHPSLSWW